MLKFNSEQLKANKKASLIAIGILIAILIGFFIGESISTFEHYQFPVRRMFLTITIISAIVNFVFMIRYSTEIKSRKE